MHQHVDADRDVLGVGAAVGEAEDGVVDLEGGSGLEEEEEEGVGVEVSREEEEGRETMVPENSTPRVEGAWAGTG